MWIDIVKMLWIFCWILYRRVREYNFEYLNRYLDILDDELDELIRGYIFWYGNIIGEFYLIGFVRFCGFRV